ncbi:MAG: S1 RNA-binding domain-containing protein [archaeon]
MESPEVGEIVIVKIKKVLDYGVIAELLEFDGLQGFIHISQVSSSWVKNIRNFVKENQTRAASVSSVDRHKDMVDLSLVKVNENAQRRKINSWKQEKRCQRLLEVLGKELKLSNEEVWQEISEPLLKDFESLYDAFQNILREKPSEIEGVKQSYFEPLIEIISKNFVLPEKVIKASLKIQCFAGNGVEVIKDSLLSGLKLSQTNNCELKVGYFGSAKYSLNLSCPDYKTGEKALKTFSDYVEKNLNKNSGTFELKRID